MQNRKCFAGNDLERTADAGGCSPAAASQPRGCALATPGWPRGIGLLPLLVLAAACGDDSTDPGVPSDEVPAVMELNGEAFVELDDGRTAACAIYLRIEVDDDGITEGDARVYRGTAGGDATRTVLDAEGDGFGFWPHLHSGATVRATPDSIELIADGAEEVTERFYQGIMHFAGERTGPGEANGTWTCAPLDLDHNGWLDTAVVAPGTWTITPADD